MRFLQLTNNWWMLIWLFGIGILFTQLNIKKTETVLGKTEYRWRWIPAVLLVLPYIVWAATRTNIGDTGAYIRMFHEMPSDLLNAGEYLPEHTKDSGFFILSILMKSVIGNSEVFYFLLIAGFQMWSLVYVYRKYSMDYFMSIFLFIASTDYISWMHNGIRQFLAATIIFACFEWMIQRKYIPLILMILLASTIHGSALLMIPIVFIIQGTPWNKKTMIFILGIILFIAFLEQFTPLLNDVIMETQYNDILTKEDWFNDDGVNLLRVLVYSVPALMSLVGLPFIKKADDPVVNICVNGSIVSMGLYLLAAFTSGIYMGRLPIYTSLMGYIALPWLIDNIFTERSAQLMKFILYGAYLFFFYYQMFIAWG